MPLEIQNITRLDDNNVSVVRAIEIDTKTGVVKIDGDDMMDLFRHIWELFPTECAEIVGCDSCDVPCQNCDDRGAVNAGIERRQALDDLG